MACPELALLVFVVKDSDGVSSELIGQSVLPVSRLRAGHRIVPLLNAACAPLRDAFLFVRLTIASVGGRRRSTTGGSTPSRRKSRTPKALRADSSVQMTRNPMDSASPRGGKPGQLSRRASRSPRGAGRGGAGARAPKRASSGRRQGV